jgi:hypothetical protein
MLLAFSMTRDRRASRGVASAFCSDVLLVTTQSFVGADTPPVPIVPHPRRNPLDLPRIKAKDVANVVAGAARRLQAAYGRDCLAEPFRNPSPCEHAVRVADDERLSIR